MRFLFAPLTLVVALIGPPAQAQTLGDIVENLIEHTERLEDRTSRLGNADSGDIQTAKSQLSTLTRYIYELRSYRQTIDGLAPILRFYEDDAGRILEALDRLDDMAGYSGRIAPLAELCDDQEREFTRDLQRIIERNNTDRSDVINAATDVSRAADGYLDTSKDIIEDIEGAHRNLGRTLPRNGDFRGVASNLEDAGDEILSREMDAAELVLDACAGLVDYEDHPGFEVAIAFFDDLDGAIERYLDDGNAWMDLHSDIGDKMCEFGQTIREEFCKLDPGATNADQLVSAYNNEIDRGSARFRTMIDDALDLYERDLAHVGANLEDYDPDVERLYARMRTRAAYYYRIQNSDELRYMSNVAERLWLVYGQQQHERIQGNSSCHVVESYIPGASPRMRVDCVDIRNCTVWEIKSDSPGNQSRGHAQAATYADNINDWMEQLAARADYEPASGSPRRGMTFDADFISHAMANFCLVEGEGYFEGDLLTYPKCRNDLELICETTPN